MATIPEFTLNDGNTIPKIGFGTAALRGEPGLAAIKSAIENGYRHLDTAANYDNEAIVGKAIRESGIPREEFFITTKIPGRYHETEAARNITYESLQRLGVDYVDLQLIHWPNPSRDQYVQAWESMIQMQNDGWIRSIGVSNFDTDHLKRIIDETDVTPAINQLEIHPYFPQNEAIPLHSKLGIQLEAWSPFARTKRVYDDEVVKTVADQLERTPAQVILRWHLQRGVLPLPKAATPARQVANLEVFDFELDENQMATLSNMGQADGRWFAGDPQTHEEM